jgi:hypothetical protein
VLGLSKQQESWYEASQEYKSLHLWSLLEAYLPFGPFGHEELSSSEDVREFTSHWWDARLTGLHVGVMEPRMLSAWLIVSTERVQAEFDDPPWALIYTVQLEMQLGNAVQVEFRRIIRFLLRISLGEGGSTRQRAVARSTILGVKCGGSSP